MPHDPQIEPASARFSSDDIAWLEAVLFTRPGELTQATWRQARSQNGIRWTALPLRGTTRRLVPAAPRFAAEAFMNGHDAMSPRRQLLGRVARAAVRSGTLRFGPVVLANRELVFADAGFSVIAAAAHGLGQPVASCAITLGPRRYNRKPVVQLMDRRARTIGFLKVGADQATSAMVATEADALERLHQPTNTVLEVPTVLWRSEWNGHSVACFSPVASHGHALMPADQQRLVAVATAVIEAGGGIRDLKLVGSSPVQRLRAEAARSNRQDIQHVLDRVDAAFGDHTVSIGAWHGDFSPWNMISSAGATALIDWEFAGHGMPVGSDMLHHRLMVATHLADKPVQGPIDELRTFGNNVPELHAMAVPSCQHRPHLVLYFLELVRRDLELARMGLSVTGFGAPAFASVQAILAEVGSE